MTSTSCLTIHKLKLLLAKLLAQDSSQHTSEEESSKECINKLKELIKE